MSNITGKGDDPFKSSWLSGTTGSMRRNYAIYPASTRGNDGTLELIMGDFYFEDVAIPAMPYKTRRGPRVARFFGSLTSVRNRNVRSPKTVTRGPRTYRSL